MEMEKFRDNTVQVCFYWRQRYAGRPYCTVYIGLAIRLTVVCLRLVLPVACGRSLAW